MELAIGTESRQEYLSFELAGAARKLVEQVMLAKPGENVVITADTSTDWRVVEATAKAAYAAEAVPTVIWYETRPTAVVEPPAPVAGAVARADVWIEFAYAYILHTPAFKTAMAAGARYICLTGMDAEMMVKTIGRVNYPKLLALGERLRQLIEAADEVRVTSPGGTDLVGYNRGRKVRQSGKLAEIKGDPIMLGGQVSWCPVEETINGKLVFDGALWPPAELGLLRNSVALTVKEGVVTKIEGGIEAQDLRALAQELQRREDVLGSPLVPRLQPGCYPPDWAHRGGRAGLRLHRDGARQPGCPDQGQVLVCGLPHRRNRPEPIHLPRWRGDRAGGRVRPPRSGPGLPRAWCARLLTGSRAH